MSIPIIFPFLYSSTTEISDMLGGYSYSNIDSFDYLDYNLLSPNSIVSEGDKFKYHYKMNAEEMSLFSMIKEK